jgi:hypothetical protein
MESTSSLFQKENIAELALFILFIIYLIMGYKIPQTFAVLIDSIIGKVIILIIVIYLFMYSNPILAVLSLFVAFDLIRRSSISTGSDALNKYMPSEEKKDSQFSAYNQFPYTLEQQVIKKMAPIKHSGASISKSAYKPTLNNLYDASPINSSN